jgi:oxygen-independent coproporphyrinogen III oxidase
MIAALYCHIPFCDEICPYCDFPKVRTGIFDESLYVEKLIEEITSKNIPEDSLRTVYLGGGTPSVLSPQNLAQLLSYLHNHFPHLQEFTLEANPESLTEEKIAILKAFHVNRVSLGVQSSKPETLALLGRRHTKEQVQKTVRLLQDNGIRNINLDFIYGTPGMTEEDLRGDLAFAYSCKPTHLSFYSLQIETGTVFGNHHLQALDDEGMATLYDILRKDLAIHGYQRYEVSNFASPGYESQHNMTYWKDEPYYACGVGASGYEGNIRYSNTRSLTHYLQGKIRATTETIDEATSEFEFLMLNLRLTSGFRLQDFQERFGKDFRKTYAANLAKVADSVGFADDRFFILPDKIYIMDQILLELLQLPKSAE